MQGLLTSHVGISHHWSSFILTLEKHLLPHSLGQYQLHSQEQTQEVDYKLQKLLKPLRIPIFHTLEHSLEAGECGLTPALQMMRVSKPRCRVCLGPSNRSFT